MKFTKEMIQAILDGKKTETRRLVKEGEILISMFDQFGDEPMVDMTHILDKKEKIKWQIGREYPIELGNKGIWYCPKCKTIFKDEIVRKKGKEIICPLNEGKLTEVKPLKFTITAIKEQQPLLDITESEAKREGFKSRKEFLKYFCKIYKISYAEPVYSNKFLQIREWNTLEVWPITFKVKE